MRPRAETWRTRIGPFTERADTTELLLVFLFASHQKWRYLLARRVLRISKVNIKMEWERHTSHTVRTENSIVPLLSVIRSAWTSTVTSSCLCGASWAKRSAGGAMVCCLVQSTLLLQMSRNEGSNRCSTSGDICTQSRQKQKDSARQVS